MGPCKQVAGQYMLNLHLPCGHCARSKGFNEVSLHKISNVCLRSSAMQGPCKCLWPQSAPAICQGFSRDYRHCKLITPLPSAGNELYDTEDWLVFATAGDGILKSMASDKRYGRLNFDPTVAIAICTKGDSRSVVEISGKLHCIQPLFMLSSTL